MFVRSLYATQDLLSANLTNLNIIYSAVVDVQKIIHNWMLLERNKWIILWKIKYLPNYYQDSYVTIKNITIGHDQF